MARTNAGTMTVEHWLTLTFADGLGPILARRLVERAGSAAAACEADAALLRMVEGVGPGKAPKIAAGLKSARDRAAAELARVDRLSDVRLITTDDDAYPLLLRSIPDPPLVLYARGTLEPRDLNAVAIVGSRKCSLYGREQAERFAALLAGAGFSVISGGARGVDSAAHRGAMQPTNGRTLAVIGSGLDVPYPPENKALFDQIAQSGCVISEFPLGTPPMAENFPRRNRIVSGMSRGVLVIEADERSGALITARQAIEDHQRVVMCIPGRVDNPQSAGPHKLIRQGATLVTRLEHILEALGPLDASVPEMPLFEPTLPAEPRAVSTPHPVSEPAPAVALSGSQAQICAVLQPTPMGVDSIIEATSLEAAVVTRELTLLTLKGVVRRIDGQGFVRVG